MIWTEGEMNIIVGSLIHQETAQLLLSLVHSGDRFPLPVSSTGQAGGADTTEGAAQEPVEASLLFRGLSFLHASEQKHHDYHDVFEALNKSLISSPPCSEKLLGGARSLFSNEREIHVAIES